MYGEQIKKLRIVNKMTQEQLADKIGVARTTVNHFEKNRRTPDVETLLKIANVFNTSIENIAGVSETKKNLSQSEIEESFKKSLELTDEEWLKKNNITYKGEKLNEEQVKSLLAYARFILTDKNL